MKIYLFCFILFILASGIMAQPTKESERSWPSEISEENTKALFMKFKAGLLPYKKKQTKITLDQVNGKSIYGVIEKIEDSSCVIKDSKNQSNTVSFSKIRGSNFFKYIEEKNKDEQALLAMGILFFYDQKFDRAEICFQRAVGLGNAPAQNWLTKAKEEIEKNKPKEEPVAEEPEEPKKEVAKVEPKPKVEPNKPPVTAPNTKPSLLPPPPKKLPPLQVPKIENLKESRKINFSQHTSPGYYTIFEFFDPECASCQQVGPQIEEIATKRAEVILRKIKVSGGSPVANQFKIKTIPYFVVCGTNGQELMRGDYNKLVPYLREWIKK